MGFNLLDYILILILAASALIGYSKGFIAVVGGIVSTLVSLVIAYLYRNTAAEYLQENYGVVSALTAWFEKRFSLHGGENGQNDMILSLPLVDEGLAFVHTQITELAYLLVAAICFLLLYILSRCLLKLLCSFLERGLERGTLGRINHIGGMILILTQNIIIMTVLAGVLDAPLELGADIGIKNLSRLEYYMEESLIIPYLQDIFMFLSEVTGIGV